MTHSVLFVSTFMVPLKISGVPGAGVLQGGSSQPVRRRPERRRGGAGLADRDEGGEPHRAHHQANAGGHGQRDPVSRCLLL